MKITQTDFKDLYVIEPTVFEDERGYFFESFHQEKFEKATGLNPDFVQDNQSRSVRGVLRGLHFQVPPQAQAKLVRVLEGEVIDLVVDLRKEEPTFGKSYSINLSSSNKKQLFIPRGFAHGIMVLSEHAEFFYKCDNYYSKEHEGGILFNDPDLNLHWPLTQEELIISEKDQKNSLFKDFKSPF